MAGRVLLEGGSGSPASTLGGKLKQLMSTADNVAKLAGSAEAALLASHGDAEAREGIRSWLNAYWEAMYELDDAVDGYNHNDARRRQQQTQEAGRSILHRFRSSSTAAVIEAEYKTLKSTTDKLDKKMHEMVQQGVQLGLQTINSNRQNWISKLPWDPKPNYYEVAGDLEQEKQKLISMLTENQTTSHVVVLFGCIGTGKTTLAWSVVNDYHIKNAFSHILWVKGSKDFTEAELLTAIASAAGLNTRGTVSMKKIEDMLAFLLQGKRFLLVLDDVWSHQIHQNFLKTCLPVQHGSRILMTSWDESIEARMSSAARTHHIKELSLSDCWSLLSNIACLDTKQCESLREIGEKIIKKCSKVPLGIQLIGGVLRTKDPTLEEWHMVSEYEGWSPCDIVPNSMKEIVGPIHLAYTDLPSYLKPCFRYCLHFPEGFMFSKYIVTQLWISEGFIDEQDGCSLEDTAEEYYKELVLRNLLQSETGSTDMIRYVLNGHVRSVLQLLTNELWIGKSRSMGSTSSQQTEIRACFRTVFLYKNPSGDRALDRVSGKYLRALDLTGTEIRHIPGPLEPLLHLRFLNLSHTEITELPESIASLRNLQFLVLQCCYRLHSLPDGISKLHNLRTLDLDGTELHLVLPRLAGLVQLTTLRGFVVNSAEVSEKDTSGWPLEDLALLDSLRSLKVVKLGRIRQHLRAQTAALSGKHHLTQLELCGSTSSARSVHAIAEEEARRLNDVLSSLRPPQCLEYLKIESYYGRSFPNWILHLTNLQRLVIADCKFCETLPSLGQLPQLKFLEVSACSELCAIVRRRTGPPLAFPKLEQLHLDDMQSFEAWEGFEAGDMPSLAEFHLQRCPRLKSLPSCLGHSMLLTSMLIISADSLEAVGSLPSLTELVVQDCKRLASISNLPALQALTVVDCSELQDVSGLKLLNHLGIVDRELTSLPDWLTRSGIVSEILTIVGREEMLGSLVPGGKDWPTISGIGKVYGNLPDGSPFFTYTKSTAVLEAFGNRGNLVASSSEDYLQSERSSPNVTLKILATRIISKVTRISCSNTRHLGALLAAIISLLSLLLHVSFLTTVFLVFSAYIGMLAFLTLRFTVFKRY